MKKEKELMAYVAGLMDGDGSFSIINEKRSEGDVFFPCIQLSNVFEGMTKLLHSTFGGCIKLKTIQIRAKKQQYVWNIRGFESCKNFIENTKEFLVLKQERAEYLLKFIDKFMPPKERSFDDLGRFTKRNRSEDQTIFHFHMKARNNDCLISTEKVVKQARKNNEDPCFWSYLAGIMDTEGSFSIRKGKAYQDCKNIRFTPLIQLSMATFETMNFIRKNLSFGKICFPKAKTTQRGFVFKLYLVKPAECIEFIKKLLPFLKFKNTVAGILLKFCENYSPTRNKSKGVPLEELIYRESCYDEIINENKYGFNKPSLIDSETLKLGDEGQV